MIQQVTETIRRYLNKGDMVLLAINERQANTSVVKDEVSSMADQIKGLVLRGDVITDVQRIALANYMLEYHTDYQAIARYFFDVLDSASRPPE